MSVWELKRETLPLVVWLGVRTMVKFRPKQVLSASCLCYVQVL